MDIIIPDVTNIAQSTHPNLFGVSLDAILSALIAIIVFIIGYYFTKKNELIKQFKHHKIVEDYLYISFKNIEKSVKEQIKSFKHLVEQLNEKKQQDIEIEYIKDYSLENIKKIKWDDYFSVFTFLKKGDDKIKIIIFQNINKSIEKIEAVNNLWIDSYNELIYKQTEYERRWNQSMEEIGKIIDTFVYWAHSTNYTHGTNNFIDNLDIIIASYQIQANCRDIYVALNSLIQPLHSLIQKNPAEYFGKLLISNILSCIYSYNNYDSNRNNYINQFENYIQILDKYIKLLNKNIKAHKTLKDRKPSFVKFWRF